MQTRKEVSTSKIIQCLDFFNIKKTAFDCFDNPLEDQEELDSSAKRCHALTSSLMEPLIGIGFASTANCFLAPNTPWYNNPFIITSILLSLNLVIRLKDIQKNTACAARTMRSASFAMIDVVTRYVFVHESGHALAALSLYKNPHPTIFFNTSYLGIGGGETRYNQADPSQIGKQLTPEARSLIVALSGSAMTMLYDLVALTVAQVIPNNYPEIKSHLRFSVLFSFLINCTYSFSGNLCSKDNSTGDYCEMKNNHISPLIATFTMIALYLLTQFILSCTTKNCRRKREELPKIEEAISTDKENTHTLIETPTEKTKLLR